MKNSKNYIIFNASTGISISIKDISHRIKSYLEKIDNDELNIYFNNNKVYTNQM